MANNIESNIKSLKLQVKKYEELSDYDKIMSEEYGEILDEKEACAFTLNEYKTTFANINNNANNGGTCDDNNFADIMKKIAQIKQNINENKGVDELMGMYADVCGYRQALGTYFSGKKMEVTNI